MAWLVIAMNVVGESPLIREPADNEYITLGDRDSVRTQVSESFPTTDWSDPTSGYFIADDQSYSLTFNISPTEPFLALGINVRGGHESIRALVKFAKSNGWVLFDCSGGWLDLDEPSEDGWRGYDTLRRSSSASRGDG